MNDMEKYLTAIEAAVNAKDKKAIVLLEVFATHVYHQISDLYDSTSGEERTAWDGMRKRAQAVIVGISKASPDIWD